MQLRKYKTDSLRTLLTVRAPLSPARLDLKQILKALGWWQREIEGTQAPNGITALTEQSMAQQPIKLRQSSAPSNGGERRCVQIPLE